VGDCPGSPRLHLQNPQGREISRWSAAQCGGRKVHLRQDDGSPDGLRGSPQLLPGLYRLRHPGRGHIRFTASKPFFLHEIILGDFSVIPKHIYSTGEFNNHPNNRAPIGSGPYRLEKWDTGQELVFARNTEYWGAAIGRQGYIDKFRWRIITDDNAAMQSALRGDLDSIGLLPKQWVSDAKAPEFEAQFNKFSYDSPAFWYIGWNQKRPYFADKRVRKALTLLLDRETIRTTVLHGLAEQLTSCFMPGTAEYKENLTPLPFDPAAAAALLDEAGWKDSNGNGIRDKDGVEFKFEILLPSSSEEWEQFATIHQEELRRTGIEMTLRQLEWASVIDTIDKRNFDALIMGWSMSPDPDMYQIWHSSQIEKGSNYVAFNVPEADKIIDDYRASFDRNERIRLCHRFHEILYEEQPYTFLFTPKANLGVAKRIHNAIVFPLFRTRPLLEWFVPAELQKYK
jgi:peptide/nickel transport system substrate-binding protein